MKNARRKGRPKMPARQRRSVKVGCRFTKREAAALRREAMPGEPLSGTVRRLALRSLSAGFVVEPVSYASSGKTRIEFPPIPESDA